MLRKFPLLMATVMLLPVVVPADLHDPNNAADYLIVTTQELIDTYPWIDQLAAWRGEHGRTAMVVATEDVWGEFGTGVPSDTVLKTFLHYARENWQEPQLKDVFIIGFHDVVPSHAYELGPDLAVLSDLFFATLDDSVFSNPLFSIGRLPWSPVQSPQLWDYFAKIIGYEVAAPNEWQTRVHLIADISPMWDFANMLAEPVAAQIQPGYVIERDYLSFPQDHAWYGDYDEILLNLEAGSYFAAFIGIGGLGYWSETLQIDSTELSLLANGVQMPIVVGMMHDVSWNEFELSGIPASLLANVNGGAIAYIANTSYAYAFSSTILKSILFRLATSDSVTTLGELWRLTMSEFIGPNGGFFSTAAPAMLMGDPGLVLPPRPTAAGDPPQELPQLLRLLGNYPNPFNASTAIKFELPRAGTLSLKVYDVLGREVTTLVNEHRVAGSYAVIWDASRAASGVYFAVLQAGDVRQAMKMMLLK